MTSSKKLWRSYLLKKFSKKVLSIGAYFSTSSPVDEKKKKRLEKKKRPSTLKQRMIAGILITIPVFLTYLVLKLLFDVLDGPFSNNIHQMIRMVFPSFRRIPGMGLVSLILLIYVVGLLASNVIGKRMLGWGEKLISQLPLVNHVYRASKQLTSAIAMRDKESFQRVVFVEYPKEDSYAIAFVTKDFEDETGQRMVAVFLPTTPNPTSGFILFIPGLKVISTKLSIEEGIKLVMSGGLVGDRQLPVTFHPPKDRIDVSREFGSAALLEETDGGEDGESKK